MIWTGYSDKSEKVYAIIVYLRLNSSLGKDKMAHRSQEGGFFILFFNINNFSLYLPKFNVHSATSHFNCIPIASAIF